MELIQEDVKKQHFAEQKERMPMTSYAVEYAPQPA
jgi:hypothetical protein